jgi:hypothetical protein
MVSPIIIFDPRGLSDDQISSVREALEAAYEAGYETARKQYQLKLDTTTTANPSPNTLQWGGQKYQITQNDCSHGIEQGTYPNAITNIANGYAVTNDITGLSQVASQRYCDHAYVNNKNKALGICGKCGISFDKWHG